MLTTVRQKIIQFLPNGDCMREKAACAMATSPTTGPFRLGKHGISFEELLDSTRQQVAGRFVNKAWATAGLQDVHRCAGATPDTG
ncbi:MAG: hypothetical protein H7274_07725 [Rhodoferax sp.]|nr:hypothetical protein [Rhodoferax sp.]